MASNSYKTSTAVLLFTRTPEQEEASKNLTFQGSRRSGLNVSRTLIRHTRKVIRHSKLDAFVIDSQSQRGPDFASRLTHAIETVFDKGYEKIIVLGNDTPDLKRDQINKAASLLDTQSLVLGPSSDGGVYLIGVHRESYDREIFARLLWESPDLQDSFNKAFSGIHWLTVLSDIDHFKDLNAFLKKALKVNPVVRLLTHLFYYVESGISTCIQIPKAVLFCQDRSERGPPVSLVAGLI